VLPVAWRRRRRLGLWRFEGDEAVDGQVEVVGGGLADGADDDVGPESGGGHLEDVCVAHAAASSGCRGLGPCGGIVDAEAEPFFGVEIEAIFAGGQRSSES